MANRTARGPQSWLRRRLGRLEILYGAVVLVTVALLWTGIAVHLDQERAQVEHGIVQDTYNATRGFEESIVRALEAIDTVLLIVRDGYERDPAGFNLNSWARNRQFVAGLTMQISLAGADGVMLMSNIPFTPGTDVSDREHVRVQKESTGDEMFISVPIIGRASKKPSINITRKLRHPDGSYAGVAVVSVDIGYIIRYGQSLDLGNGEVLLAGLDGVIRARWPSVPDLDQGKARRLTGAEARYLLSGPHGGTFTATSGIDGVRRVVTYSKLERYKLVVAVGEDEAEQLADYVRHRLQLTIAGGALTLFALILGVLLIRQHLRVERSQTALRATLENMSQGIVMVDREGMVPVINQRAIELLGLPPAATERPRRFTDMLRWQLDHGEFGPREAVDPAFLRFVESGGISTAFSVYERVRANGTALEIRTEILDDGSAVRTYTDTTARRAAEAALAAARDAAEAGGRARTEFLAVMSHEIRTPMNGILGVAGLLLDQPLEPAARQYAQIIQDSGNHLLALINDILDFSRLDAGQLALEEAPFNLRGVVRSTIDLLSQEAGAKGLELRMEVADDVPARAVGDARRLRQVLLNLVGNGIKFTAAGSVHVAVARMGQEPGGVRLAFSVTDTGIGIPQEAQGKLFTLFTQVDSTISRRYGGSGLGLAISRRLIEHMGGTITVDSAAGRGSRFQFDVLLRVQGPGDAQPEGDRDAGTDAAPAGPSAPADAAAVPRWRILVAEDNATNRLVATRMLEHLGHEVEAVTNGLEAVEAVRNRAYDAVLMDVMMPEMDGLSATAEIRRLSGPAAGIPIIGLTANALRADKAACLAAGMDHFATKPIRAARLAEVIAQAMAGRTDTGAGFDVTVLEEMVGDIGAAATEDVVRLFEETGQRIGPILRQLAAQGEATALMRAAHALAGSARGVGLTALARASADLENAAAAGQAGEFAEQAVRLEALLRTGIAALRRWRR